jgi:hypothetical protein
VVALADIYREHLQEMKDMTNEYVEAYRLFAKAAGMIPDESVCVFVVEARPGGDLLIHAGKPGTRDEPKLRRIVREEIAKVLSAVIV